VKKMGGEKMNQLKIVMLKWLNGDISDKEAKEYLKRIEL